MKSAGEFQSGKGDAKGNRNDARESLRRTDMKNSLATRFTFAAFAFGCLVYKQGLTDEH
jgi:alpha/beta superfamily hydrolase